MGKLDQSVGFKTCSRCHQHKPFDAFNQDRRYQFGVTGWCRDCKNQRSRERDREVALRPKRDVSIKQCTHCHKTWPASEFAKAHSKLDGLKSWCKRCINEASERRRMTTNVPKANHLWSHYRLRLPEFEAMLANQQGQCAICREAMPKPVVDHCHTTGKVRGLLCYRCNTRLYGLEHPEWREKAESYLKR